MNELPAPYASGENWTLYHGDCLSILPLLEAGSIDAVVTDPPYSSGGAFRGDRMASTSAKYSGWSQGEDGGSVEPEAEYPEFTGDNKDQRSYLHWSSLWLSFAQSSSTSGAVVALFTDWRQLPVTTDAVQSGNWLWRGIVVWDKGVGRPVMGRFRNHVEYVVWGSNGPMRKPEPVYPSTVCRSTPPTSSSRVHRTEKPVEAIEHLLTICPVNGTVLDPFTGSGTTGVACIKTGRKFIGIEIDEHYCEIAANRLRKAEADKASQLIGGAA